MSRFSGRQYKGAQRVLNEIKREEAEQRQADHNARMEVLSRLAEGQENLDVLLTTDQVIEDLKAAGVKMENPGPVLPGLVQRNRKVRGVVRNQRKSE